MGEREVMTGDCELIIEERDLLCDEGEEAGFDVGAALDTLDTLDFATCWRQASFLSPYLNGTGMLDGRAGAGTALRRLAPTSFLIRRESIETALSCVIDGVRSQECLSAPELSRCIRSISFTPG